VKWLTKLYYRVGEDELVRQLYIKLVNEYGDILADKEKAMMRLLDGLEDYRYVTDLYDASLVSLEKRGNKKAALRLKLNQAKILLKKKDWNRLSQILEGMYLGCILPDSDGSDDLSKSDQLLDIFAISIQFEEEKQNHKRLKELYNKALSINGVCNPKTYGIIYECGGKIHLRDSHWHEANTAFIEAFRNYDEVGARSEAISSLKYLVLTNMLSGSNINPFDEPRAKSYSSSPEIASMNDLVEAYQKNSLSDFERILITHKSLFIEDHIFQIYLPLVLKSLKTRIFLDLVKPCMNLSTRYLEQQLQLTTPEVEALIVDLILDGKINATLDQISSVLYLRNPINSETNRKYLSCGSWVKHSSTLSHSITNKVS
jgi:COP9 signalosome complex subunit 2